jgi:hypothetical protein
MVTKIVIGCKYEIYGKTVTVLEVIKPTYAGYSIVITTDPGYGSERQSFRASKFRRDAIKASTS